MSAGESGQFKVSISAKEFQKLKSWGEWAKSNHVLDEYLAALKTIDYRLAFEPAEWGEPKYSLRKLKLDVRFGTVKMLNVWYGVSLARRVVYVKVFQFRADYPPGRPPDAA